MNNNQIHDLVIIGTGVAGLAASVYAGRYRLDVLAIGREFGGETTLAGQIENYPGFKVIEGLDLMMKMREQAESLGVKVMDGTVTEIERQEHCFTVKTGQESFQANAVIFAMGTERRHLNLPNEKELTGRGVHYCVTCDGPLYTGKTIVIVGGGDASVKGVNLAAEYAQKIYLIVRGQEIIAEPINHEEMKKLGHKVEVLFETEVKEIVGDKKLEKVILNQPHNGSVDLITDGLFVEIGANPKADLAKNLGVELDERGYIKVDNMMKTNVDGVFAAGDVTNHFNAFKQDITAAAQGAVAATSAYEDHRKHGDLCALHVVPTPKRKAVQPLKI